MLPTFDQWYRESYPRTFAAVQLASRHHKDAADACASAYLKALERWTRVRRLSSPEGWVFVVAMNDLRRSLRKQAREVSLAEHAPDTQGGDGIEEFDSDLQDALDALTPRQRTVLVARAVLDVPARELARRLGVREGTIWATYSVARQKVADHLTHTSTTLTPRGLDSTGDRP